MCYFQGYVIVWFIKKFYEKFFIYSIDRIINIGKLKDGVVFVFEFRKDIFIIFQQEVLRVLKLLRNFNRKVKAAVLCREMFMIFLLDENRKFLFVFIDNIGFIIMVVFIMYEVVYSYNVLFNGRCRNIIVVYIYSGIVFSGLKFYIYSYLLLSQNDRIYYFELQKVIYFVKVIDYFVLFVIDSVLFYLIVYDFWFFVKSKRLKLYFGRFFKVIYNGFKENKIMMLIMLGVKLKY